MKTEVAKKPKVPPTHSIVHPTNSNLSSAIWVDDGISHTVFSARWFNATRGGFKIKNWLASEVREIIELCILSLLRLNEPVSPNLTSYLQELADNRSVLPK